MNTNLSTKTSVIFPAMASETFLIAVRTTLDSRDEVIKAGEPKSPSQQEQPRIDVAALATQGVSPDEWEGPVDGLTRTRAEHLYVMVALAYEELANAVEECQNEDGTPNALAISKRLAERAKDPKFDKVLFTGQAVRTLRDRYRIGQDLLDKERGTPQEKISPGQKICHARN